MERPGRRCLQLAISLVVVGVCLSACSGGDVAQVKSVVVYCSPGGAPLTMDIYRPAANPRVPPPIIVYVHGGGWTTGSSSLSPIIRQIETSIIDAGFAFASINYRLAPVHPWPAQIQDAKCAIRFLRAAGPSLKLDTHKIGAVGDSAGGQLVSLLGLTGPAAGFDVGQYPGESSSVQAVADLYGPADLTSDDWNRDRLLQPFAEATFGQPLGYGSPELAAASPVSYVARGAPPFLVIQGTRDAVVPPTQAQELVDRLAAVGDTVTEIKVHGANHGLVPVGSSPITPSVAQVSQSIAQFFSHALRQ